MITDQEIDNLYLLSKLTLKPELREEVKKWLSETLDYITVLDELDTANVRPTTQVTGLTNVFRKDLPTKENELNLSGTYFKTSITVVK
ncbi:aspartyl/glutamyl-tRNA amidotransferase subunit C [Candidatus Parcubacteria bacterium]|nr:Asp-tRNA(Asn)/Glu-tRNA(Gln) amidotransferase GatCAB subunit C [Patescibacteria group bacterium]MBU4380878.1 Asp-tRNA(Asn)/Glu-tRNA(Gln) amidotransferase GatCAB subunit C [Patescibacteria group bacterium]MCG2688929.1 aspartyl/glutamyl-tRNA amidotransferase subunit C [Candidatus Parcubacteria bacterium]